MKTKTFIWALCASVLCFAQSARAGLLFTEDFEGWNLGTLDKNDATGPNAAPNGSGNPWFGPAPPNGQVIETEFDIPAHSGTKMLRGRYVTAADFDQNWYNLAYRLNSGAPYAGSIMLDWYFYDPLGPGGSDLRDYAAFGYYDTCPLNTDHPASGSLNTGVVQIQRLSLGASSNRSTGYDAGFYQARVVGRAGYAAGWFNLPVARTIGWHKGRIIVGPPLADLSNMVSFFIDDMVNPAFVSNSTTKWGYNVIELNTKHGPQTGYFDDVRFSTVPTISGKLQLGDFTGDVSKLTANFEIGGAGYPLEVIPNVPLGADGSYAFSTSLSGTSDIVVKVSHWLTARSTQTWGDGGLTGMDFSLINGDIDGDNAVTVFDYNSLSDAFDSVEGDGNWNAMADLDGDGGVTVFDYNILSNNFDLSGE